MANDPRIKIIIGHFGSGKTEIAINLSLIEKEQHDKVALSDLDVINLYFRSREVRTQLEQYDIELIAPTGKIATADLPYVSGELNRVICDSEYKVIIDVGGDKDGAVALGQFYNQLKNQDHQMYFVVNTNRPYVSTVEGIKETIKQIEVVTRLKTSALINNTNLCRETTVDNIIQGFEITSEAGKQLNLPVLYTTISSHLKEETKEFARVHDVLYIERFMKLPWE